MVVGKFTKIEPFREAHNDHLYVFGVSDLERGRLSCNVYGEDGKRLGGTTFQTKLDGSWGPRSVAILQKIPIQKLTVELKTEDGKETLDKKIFDWKGFEKSPPIKIPQNLLNAEPEISIADLTSKLENSLRKVLLQKPNRELDIHDAIEQLLAGTNYEGKFTRDAESIPISGRSYRKPDFVFDELGLALEAKFCNSKKDSKDIVEEMNADIHPYKKRYQNLIFLVYDLGFILDEDEFVRDFHQIPDVRVVIVKH